MSDGRYDLNALWRWLQCPNPLGADEIDDCSYENAVTFLRESEITELMEVKLWNAFWGAIKESTDRKECKGKGLQIVDEGNLAERVVNLWQYFPESLSDERYRCMEKLFEILTRFENQVDDYQDYEEEILYPLFGVSSLVYWDSLQRMEPEHQEFIIDRVLAEIEEDPYDQWCADALGLWQARVLEGMVRYPPTGYESRSAYLFQRIYCTANDQWHRHHRGQLTKAIRASSTEYLGYLCDHLVQRMDPDSGADSREQELWRALPTSIRGDDG